jgi:hypothetical protein
LIFFFANDTPSGQSIPNRAEVKDAKGVKIYFDPVSTALREETVRKLTAKVCADADALCARLDARETIVYHVAAHGAVAAVGCAVCGCVFFFSRSSHWGWGATAEIGHAIYGLSHVEHVIQPATRTLLEEPRAELTTLHALKVYVFVKVFFFTLSSKVNT